MSQVQLQRLKQAAKKCKWSRRPTLSEVLTAVARLGGHIKSNGRPGWQVLARGWTRLMTLEAGYRMAMALQEEGLIWPTQKLHVTRAARKWLAHLPQPCLAGRSL